MRSLKALCLVLLCAAADLGGCAEISQREPWQKEPAAGTDCCDWLVELQRVSSLTTDELAREKSTKEQAFADDSTPENRLSLALVLVTAKEPVGDEAMALKLMEDFPVDETDAATAMVARHLLFVLRQRDDAETELQKARQELTSLQRDLKEANGRIRELEEQLQALTSIEESINLRIRSQEPKTQ
jgi:hypothetical protein